MALEEEKAMTDPKPMKPNEVEKAITEMADGKKYLLFRGKEITFRPLTLGESSKLSQEMSDEVLQGTLVEGTLNEAMVDGVLLKKIKELGMDPRVADQSYRMQWLLDVYQKVGSNVFSEEGEPDIEFVRENADDILGKFSEEDLERLNQVNVANRFHEQLNEGTIEAKARVKQRKREMIFAVVNGKGKPLWKDMNSLEKEPDDIELKKLFKSYQSWKEGHPLDFLSESPLHLLGSDSGLPLTKTKAKSSKAKPRSGRKTSKKSSK